MSSLQKKATASPDLRRRVNICIDKLSDRATLSQAYSQLKSIALNLQQPPSLSTFLSCILSIDSSFKSPVRVHCLNLISLLPHSTLSPHISKITATLLRRLRDNDSSVRAACVAVAGSLSPVGFSSLFAPLVAAILSERDTNAQIGSCLCLKAAVDYGELDGGDELEIGRVLPRMLKVVRGEGFKAKGALLSCVESIVRVNEGGVVNNGMVEKVVVCAVEMLSSDDWAARKAAAEVLETVAVVAERGSVMEFKQFCVSSLDSRRFDKVKMTRDTMNRALEAWRKDPGGGPDQDLLFSPSNSTGGSSACISRRSSFAGIETLKPKKTISKKRSSLPDGLISCSNTSDMIGLETCQRTKTISESRSSLSDDSTITDNSSVSKSSHDVGFETLQSNTKRASISRRTSSNSKVKTQDDAQYAEDEAERLSFERVNEEMGECSSDGDEILLIRVQLLQIEKQQSNLLDLLQRFMGNSQNGIDSLETRVTGVERALDELAVQSGSFPKNKSGESTCTEFLRPEFWRKTEGRSSKSTYPSGILLDGYRFKEQNEEATLANNIGQSPHRGRTCRLRGA